MIDRLEDLWDRAASDGASCPAELSIRGSPGDIDQLMSAWYDERTDRIECTLLLDQARRLVSRILSEAEMTPRRRKQALLFLQASRAVRNRQRGRDDL